MDVLLLFGIDAFLMHFLVIDVTLDAKEECHEFYDGALKKSCILIYLGREDRLVKGFLVLVDDNVLNVVGLMELCDG